MRPRLAIERLSAAISERRFLWVLCKRCGRSTRLDPRHLMTLGGDMTLRELQERLRCRRCRAQKAAIVVNDSGWPARD